MKKIKGYDKAQVYQYVERLPVGGYVLKILNVEYVDNSDKNYGDVIVLSFDIAEGDYKDFYKKNCAAQTSEDKKWKGNYRLYVPTEDGTDRDEWTTRRFKTVISNIEESNSGFHWDWDEAKLKGKKIGALFNNKEYDFNGRSGMYTNCHSLVTVEKIKSGSFEIPADTLLKENSAYRTPAPSSDDGFMDVPEGIDEELPFS